MKDFKAKVEDAIERGNNDTLKIIYDTFDTDIIMANGDISKINKAKENYLNALKKSLSVYQEALSVKDRL